MEGVGLGGEVFFADPGRGGGVLILDASIFFDDLDACGVLVLGAGSEEVVELEAGDGLAVSLLSVFVAFFGRVKV